MIRPLESYEDFQDYLAGYEPSKDNEHLKDQQKQQKAFDQIRQIMPLLDPKRKRLIGLFLKYGFQYKEIAAAMGTGITEISNEKVHDKNFKLRIFSIFYLDPEG